MSAGQETKVPRATVWLQRKKKFSQGLALGPLLSLSLLSLKRLLDATAVITASSGMA